MSEEIPKTQKQRMREKYEDEMLKRSRKKWDMIIKGVARQRRISEETKMKSTKTIEYPDMTIISKDKYHDKLDITVTKGKVEFTAHVDGCGNTWKLDKEILQGLVR